MTKSSSTDDRMAASVNYQNWLKIRELKHDICKEVGSECAAYIRMSGIEDFWYKRWKKECREVYYPVSPSVVARIEQAEWDYCLAGGSLKKL